MNEHPGAPAAAVTTEGSVASTAQCVQAINATQAASLALRAIGPNDLEREKIFLAGLSAESLRNRMLCAGMRDVPAAELRRLTNPVAGQEFAVAATIMAEGREQFAGVARYALTSPNEAEYAIVVADVWQRCGLGRRLLEHVIKTARERGIARLHGHMLASNRPGIDLACSLGFRITPHPDGASLRLARLELVG